MEVLTFVENMILKLSVSQQLNSTFINRILLQLSIPKDAEGI